MRKVVRGPRRCRRPSSTPLSRPAARAVCASLAWYRSRTFATRTRRTDVTWHGGDRYSQRRTARPITPGALIWRSEAHEESRTPRWRLISAASAATLALVMAVLAPGLAARVAEHRAIIHATGISRCDACSSTRCRGSRSRHIGSRRGRRVRGGGRPVTFLAVALAHALPDGAALLALHVDSSGGSVVALAPRAAALLTRLEQVPHLAALEIVGPVTRETDSGHAVERVTIRFRWMGEP